MSIFDNGCADMYEVAPSLRKKEDKPIEYEDYKGYSIVLRKESGLTIHVMTDRVVSYLTMTWTCPNITRFKKVIDAYLLGRAVK